MGGAKRNPGSAALRGKPRMGRRKINGMILTPDPAGLLGKKYNDLGERNQ